MPGLHRHAGERRRRRVVQRRSRASRAIAAIGRAHRRFGTTGFLPTLISDDLHVVERAIDAVRDAITQGVPGVLGIHIEGPFLSNERRGVHDAEQAALARRRRGEAADARRTAA